MGRLTMFDDLKDLHPPTPGLRELAVVATRARAIRRRRAAVGMWSTIAAVVVVSGAGVWWSTTGPGNDRIVTAPATTDAVDDSTPGSSPVATVTLRPSDSTNQSTVESTVGPSAEGTTTPASSPPTAPAASDTLPPGTTQPASSVVPGTVYTFDQAGEIDELPPIELEPGAEGLAGFLSASVTVSGDAAGGVCVSVNGGTLGSRCAAAGASFLFLPWPDPSTEVPPITEFGAGAGDLVVLVVDDSVQVAFLTVGASCRVESSVGGLPVNVWLCEGLDTSRSTIEVRSSDRVLISTAPTRGETIPP